jgi:hypothetical protein
MDEVARYQGQTFNGPLEAGVRAVAVLAAAFPRSYDLQRLTAFDYLLVYTGQLGGPEDLHPATPIHAPATEVRRKVVQDALNLMMTRELVVRHAATGEMASTFMDSLQTNYLSRVKERAEWLVQHLARYSDAEFDALMRRFFDNWVIEFQAAERSLGVD